jgi:glycosyltransferase involved in cell wall biosynthesis
MQVLMTTTRAWYLGQTARAFSDRRALAGLWMADANRTGLPPDQYQRCWPYHLAIKPFYHLTSQIWQERATYWLTGLWRAWLRAKLNSPSCPQFQVAHAILGFAGEIFDRAEQVGALKVADCPNTHPAILHGFWQRECDLWCPGERIPIPQWMFARMNRELERADLILCPSQFVAETMLLNGLRPQKCFCNPFGVDTSIFTPRKTVPGVPRFLCVGTICVRKGHQYLFRAFEMVKRALPEAELVCVGEYKTDFRKERPKWEGRFEHHPSLSHPALNGLMKTCTAFVLPSCEEGFARVLTEAMAAGLPIIATHESGASTVVAHGVEGFIVPRRPEVIAGAMLELAKDPERCASMGRAAHLKGAVRNTWQDYGDRILEECRQRLAAQRLRKEN